MLKQPKKKTPDQIFGQILEFSQSTHLEEDSLLQVLPILSLKTSDSEYEKGDTPKN